MRPPRVSPAAAGAALVAALAYPATILGGVLIFVLSSQIALGLLASSIDAFTSPAGVTADFNVPAPVQLAELHPKPTPKASATATTRVESSFTTVPAPASSTVFTLGAPTESSFTSLAGPNATRVGPSAVNLRSGPSNEAAVLGVLAAGTPVSTSAADKGWVMVSADGATGWVYQSFLEGSLSITESGGVATADP